MGEWVVKGAKIVFGCLLFDWKNNDVLMVRSLIFLVRVLFCFNTCYLFCQMFVLIKCIFWYSHRLLFGIPQFCSPTPHILYMSLCYGLLSISVFPRKYEEVYVHHCSLCSSYLTVHFWRQGWLQKQLGFNFQPSSQFTSLFPSSLPPHSPTPFQGTVNIPCICELKGSWLVVVWAW